MSTQISAEISDSTRELLEYFVANTGMKKGFVIEQALLNYLRALNELPVDVLLSAKIVLGKQSAARVVKDSKTPPRPTRELKRLMADED